MFLNLLLVFSMIFIANKTREIEKANKEFNLKISNITENIKINKIELISYQNSTYLNKLHSLYFPEMIEIDVPVVISFKEFSQRKNNNIKLISSNK